MITKDLGNDVIAQYDPKKKLVTLTAKVGFGGFSIIFMNAETLKNFLEWIKEIERESQNEHI